MKEGLVVDSLRPSAAASLQGGLSQKYRQSEIQKVVIYSVGGKA
jgi:hypothetical protein